MDNASRIQEKQRHLAAQRQAEQDRTTAAATSAQQHQDVLDALAKQTLVTLAANDPALRQTATELMGTLQQLHQATATLQASGLDQIATNVGQLVSEVARFISEFNAQDAGEDAPDLTPELQAIRAAVERIDVRPNVTVSAPASKVDLSPLLSGLEGVQRAVEGLAAKETTEFDTSSLEAAMRGVQSTIENLRFPTSNYILPFKDSSGKSTQVQLDGSGNLPINVSGSSPSAAKYGRATVSVTNTAVQLGSNTVSGVNVQALSTNTNSVYVGDSSVTTSNGFELQPGQATSVAIGNTNALYINGTASDGVCFIGS